MRAHGATADEWFDQSRESRIFMTSGFVARQLIDAINKDDALQEIERERKKHPRGGKTHRPPARRRGRR